MSLKKNMGDTAPKKFEYPAGSRVSLVMHVLTGATTTRNGMRDGKTTSFACRDATAVVCDGFTGNELVVHVDPESRKGMLPEDADAYAKVCVIHPGLRFSLRLKSGSPEKLVGQVVVVNMVLYSTMWTNKDGNVVHGFRGVCDQPVSPVRANTPTKPVVTLPITEFRAPVGGSVPIRAGMEEDGLNVHGVISDLDAGEFSFGDERKPQMRFTGTMDGVPVSVKGWSTTRSLGLGKGDTGPECGDAWTRFATMYLALGRPVCSGKIDGDRTATEVAANSGRIVLADAGLSMPTAAELSRFALPIGADAAKKVIETMEDVSLPPATVADGSPIYLLPGKHAGTRMSIIGAEDAKATIWYLPGLPRKPSDIARVLAAVQTAAKAKCDDMARIKALNDALGAEVVPKQCMLLVVAAAEANGVDAAKEIRDAWARLFASLERKRPRAPEPVKEEPKAEPAEPAELSEPPAKKPKLEQ